MYTGTRRLDELLHLPGAVEAAAEEHATPSVLIEDDGEEGEEGGISQLNRLSTILHSVRTGVPLVPAAAAEAAQPFHSHDPHLDAFFPTPPQVAPSMGAKEAEELHELLGLLQEKGEGRGVEGRKEGVLEDTAVVSLGVEGEVAPRGSVLDEPPFVPGLTLPSSSSSGSHHPTSLNSHQGFTEQEQQQQQQQQPLPLATPIALSPMSKPLKGGVMAATSKPLPPALALSPYGRPHPRKGASNSPLTVARREKADPLASRGPSPLQLPPSVSGGGGGGGTLKANGPAALPKKAPFKKH